jgi:hypothetical protein
MSLRAAFGEAISDYMAKSLQLWYFLAKIEIASLGKAPDSQ